MMNWNKTKVEWHGKMVTVIWVNCTSYTAEELYRTISDAMDANCYNVVTKKGYPLIPELYSDDEEFAKSQANESKGHVCHIIKLYKRYENSLNPEEMGE